MTKGCLVMAYGTPASLDDLEAYYTHIRRGRPPEPAQLDELRGRYEAIGGSSPLRAITAAQAGRIAAALGDGWVVAQGHKHAPPFIEDGVATLVQQGVDEIIGVVLAPHFSQGSIGEYALRLETAAGSTRARTIPQWSDLNEWIGFEAAAVRHALTELPDGTTVLFTAHSLPERVLADDPYPDQLYESAAAIADRAGVDYSGWDLAWQSAGRTPEPWRGPDILEVMGEVTAPGLLVCPQGFVADHLEVLYDLDVQAAAQARTQGLAFARTRSLNDDPGVLTALAERIADA